MDFLSYLTLKQAEQLRIDAVVLNSVVNIGKAIPFLQRHRAVHTFFDNDDAGRPATAQVQHVMQPPIVLKIIIGLAVVALVATWAAGYYIRECWVWEERATYWYEQSQNTPAKGRK